MYVLKKNAISPCLDIEINVIIIIIIIKGTFLKTDHIVFLKVGMEKKSY